MQIAQNILQQLGGNKFLAMTGAKNLVGGKDSLKMQIGRNAKRVTHVRVSLSPADLYNVEFFSIRGLNVRTLATREGVDAESLRRVFETETGLYTSL